MSQFVNEYAMAKVKWWAVVFVLAVACGGPEGQRGGPTATGSPSIAASSPAIAFGGPVIVRIGEHEVRAEVASTPDQRALGLMHRTELGEDDGMLFLFPQTNSGGFWMKNTLIPLSIAYMSAAEPRDDGFPRRYTIGTILDMEPCPPGTQCPSYPPKAPYDATLEVNQGWFGEAGINEGAEVVIDGPLPSPSA